MVAGHLFILVYEEVRSAKGRHASYFYLSSLLVYIVTNITKASSH